MRISFIDGYEKADDVRALFDEYTAMLIEGDPNFKHYLELQNYDDELAHLEHKYGRPNGRLYLAYADDRLVGCIALKQADAITCEMKRLYVRPAFRGQGIANQLLTHLMAEARQIGYRHMRLDTLPFLTAAIALYQKYGFYEIPPYNDNPMGNSIYMMSDL